MSLLATTGKLFESKEEADVTFIIDKKELQAHQFVLAARSPVLKAMIKGPMAPANQRHPISDPQVSYDDFNNFLKFLYADKCDINVDNIEVLLHLSHMYDVPHLFETCVNELPKFFYKIYPLQFADLGLLYDNKCNMVIKCIHALENHVVNPRLFALNYAKQNKCVWISPELVIEFAKHCLRTETFTENVVFQKVFEWVQQKCEEEKREINAKNLKEIMVPFEPYIHFELMDMQILTSTVYEYKLIPDERLLKCFRDHIVQKEGLSTSGKLNTFTTKVVKSVLFARVHPARPAVSVKKSKYLFLDVEF